MFGLVVRFDLKPQAADEFDRLARRTLESIKTDEPGTIVYSCHGVVGDPNARVFYEIYKDRGAFEAHEATSHVRTFLAERSEYFATEPRVEFLTEVDNKGLPQAAAG